MNFKKAIILSSTLLLTFVGGTFAQSSNVRKAMSNLQEFEKFRSAGTPQLGESYLALAKEAIEAAAIHEKSKNEAETWVYYALVHGQLAYAKKEQADIDKTAEGLAKAKELDKDNKNAQNLDVAKQLLYSAQINKGFDYWNANNFESAYKSFETGLASFPSDTSLTYYAAEAAYMLKNYEVALEKFKQLIDTDNFSSHRRVVFIIPQTYLNELKDTTNALKYYDIAVKKFPEDQDIATQNIQLNLMVGNEAKVITDISSQIQKDPNNKLLHYYLGIAESSNENNDKALAAFKKAIEIDPEFSDAHLRTGIIITNQVRKELNDLNASNVQGDAKRKKITELQNKFKESVPYFTKAFETDAKNVTALRGLKQYYDFVEDEANSKLTQEKIDAIQ